MTSSAQDPDVSGDGPSAPEPGPVEAGYDNVVALRPRTGRTDEDPPPPAAA
jgi:hypothetical protein